MMFEGYKGEWKSTEHIIKSHRSREADTPSVGHLEMCIFGSPDKYRGDMLLK